MTDDCPTKTDISPSTASDPHEHPRDQISTDEVHRLLASKRRRDLLTYLTTHSADSVPIDDLTEFVAEREGPAPGPETSRERIAADLHHVHVPKLADAGVVTYDPVAGTVQYEASETVEAFLSATNTIEDT